MSLILDALKKAEQDRNAGQAPALDELLVRPTTVRPGRRVRNDQRDVLLMAAVIAALLFAAAGLIYWLWPSNAAPPPEAATAAAPAAETAPPAAEPAPALRVDPERLAPPVGDAPEERLDLGDTGASEAATLDELDGEAAAPVAKNVPPLIARPEPSAPVATPSAPGPATAGPPPAEKPPPEPSVRPLKEMPPGFRSEFPPLSLDVHVYDGNPLRRFALINGKKYRETDTLVEGPRVLEITPFGVIVEHRGSRVLLELPR